MDLYLFMEKPNKSLVCPSCEKVFLKPTIIPCGHTLCEVCINNLPSKQCPQDQSVIDFVLKNKALEDQITELLIHCKHGFKVVNGTGSFELDPDGCPSVLKVSEMQAHEADCAFVMIPCPNDRDCPLIAKKDLDAHLRVCGAVRCSHDKFGCEFRGSAEEVSKHVQQSCHFEPLKKFLRDFDESSKELHNLVRQKDEEICFLKSMLGRLSERIDVLESEQVQRLGNVEDNQTKLLESSDEFRRNQDHLFDLFEALRERFYQSIPDKGPFDPSTIYKCIGTFVGHKGPVWCLTTHEDLLFSGSTDSTIKVWKIGLELKCFCTLEGHTASVLALCVHEGKLYSGSQDNTIIAWDLESFTMLSTISAHDNPVCTLTTSRNMLFSGSLKTIKVWDTSSYSLIREISSLSHWVRALLATSKHLYCGSYQAVKIFDLENFECIETLETFKGSVYSLGITDKFILCGTSEHCIHVWDISNYSPVTVLSGHSGTVYALSVLYTHSGTKVFSASDDLSLRVWSMENLICTQTLLRHHGSVSSLSASRGKVFSGSVDNTVKVWQW